MGLLISVYRNAERGMDVDCTNGGVSSTHGMFCLVNASGPFEPNEDRPAVIMQQHQPGCLRIVPAYADGKGNWIADKYHHRMMGGNYGATSDSRFAELCERLLGHRFYGAVAIHDRVE
jgi:hypothetical protein